MYLAKAVRMRVSSGEDLAREEGIHAPGRKFSVPSFACRRVQIQGAEQIQWREPCFLILRRMHPQSLRTRPVL